MRVKDIYKFLNELSPFELQEKWDNSGLLVGNPEDSVKEVHISLDLDEEVLENVPENSLIITHHPLIFSALKQINYNTYATKLLKILIKKDISLICMHTNFDVSHLNKYVAKEILGLDVEETQGYVTYAYVNQNFEAFQKNIEKKLSLQYTKAVQCHEKVTRVALITGAGASMIDEIEADCFLTGDIKYHDAMEAKLRKISLIDIGHYESEHHFSPLLLGLCEKYLKINKLKAIITASKNPFKFQYQGETVE